MSVNRKTIDVLSENFIIRSRTPKKTINLITNIDLIHKIDRYYGVPTFSRVLPCLNKTIRMTHKLVSLGIVIPSVPGPRDRLENRQVLMAPGRDNDSSSTGYRVISCVSESTSKRSKTLRRSSGRSWSRYH